VADSNFTVDINANDNVSSVLSKISRNLESLTNNFGDLAGVVKDLSGGMKTATTSSVDSMDKLAKSSDKVAETVTKNFSSILRSSQTTLLKLQPGINKAAEAIEKLTNPEGGRGLSSGQKNLSDFSSLRDGATSSIARISQLRDQIQALYPEARKGSEAAAEGIKSLTQQYREAAAGLKRYQEQLQSGSSEFSRMQGTKNSMLSSMGYKPITLNDIFPTAEQQKFDDLQRRMQAATFRSIQQGAVRDTLNGFLSTNLQLKQVDDNVLRIATHLPRMRYALYDVANSAAATGAALLAIPVATIAIAASFERDFADVQRTVAKGGEDVSALKQDLIELSQSIPVSFKALTEIGTLAGQLDIAQENVANFTETVAKFAATTDVTINEAATAFGRISQLIDGVDGQFDRLGSSIAKVGVNSVATESQIIRITSQISSIGNLAGFSADQIIGLAGSLASVGTAPELARGTVVRLFTEINGAVSGSNNNLDKFASLAGQTAEEFRTTWGEGGGAYQIVAFLRGLDAQGIKAEQTLRSLNIQSVRDIPTILKLATSYKEVAASLDDAESGWRENTELQRQYNIITNTLSEKINILVNNFKAFIAAAGSATGPISFLVDGFIKIVQAATTIINNPINGFFISTGLAITGLLGVLGLLGGSISRLSGGFLGLVEAQIRVREAIGNARVAYSEGAVAARALAASQAQVATTSGRMSGLLVQTVADTKANAAGFRAFAGSIKEVVFASAAFKAIMSTVLITSGIGIALVAISAAWESIANATKSASDRAREYYGDTSSIIRAAYQDTEELSQGLQTQADIWKTLNVAADSGGLKNTATEAARAIGPVSDLSSQNEELKDSLNLTTEALQAQELAFGNNAEAAALKLVQDKILSDADNPITKLYSDEVMRGVLDKAGFNLEQFTQNAITGNEEAVKAAIKNLEQFVDSQGEFTYNPGFILDGLDQNYFAQYQAISFLEDYADKTIGLSVAQDAAVQAVKATGQAVDEQGNLIEDTSESLEKYKEAFNAAFGDIDAVGELYSSMETLQSGIEANGTAFDLMSSGGVQNLSNLQDALFASVVAAQAMGGTAAQGIAYVFAQLAAQGVDTAALLARVAGMSINGVTINAQEVATAMGKIPANTFKKIGTSAGGAAKQVKTLADYASDLSSVFSRSFDIRFDGQSTLDGITSSWRDMAEASEDANQKIKDLRADLDSLTADKALQEYFLSVANAYGDTLAAAQIQAKLNKINNQLASTNEDLSDAQSDANKTLVGSSTAAIRNRAEVLNMVKAYQDHLKALAASGMGQDELAAKSQQLRADFYAQAQAMGYNTGELGTYALAFDDMTTIIGRVPRDITVDANVDPALQALNEFVAQAASSGGSAGGAFGSSFLDALRASIEDNEPSTPGGYLGIPGLLQGSYGVPFYLQGTQNGSQYVNGVKTGIEATTPTLTPSFNPWVASSQSAANRSRDAFLNTLPQVPQYIARNPPSFTPWSTAGANAALNTQRSWQGTANNIPTQISNQAGPMSWAFSRLSQNAKSGWNTFAPSSGAQLSNIFKWYSSGGYTGAGGMYEPAGIVHKGEYVVPKSEVNQVTKIPYFMEAQPQYAMGGYVSQSGQMGGMVSLSPEDRALLRAAGGSGQIVLYANNEAIARSANDGNRSIVAAGGRP